MFVLLTVQTFLCLVATKDLTSKDALTSQAMHKLLEVQRTLECSLVQCWVLYPSPPPIFTDTQ